MQRPSGASMPAAVNMTRVAGSSVSRAAVTNPRPHLPRCSMEAARAMADSEEEQAVSMLTDGPAGGKCPIQRVAELKCGDGLLDLGLRRGL